jgi:hypothetical protein
MEDVSASTFGLNKRVYSFNVHRQARRLSSGFLARLGDETGGWWPISVFLEGGSRHPGGFLQPSTMATALTRVAG